MSSLLFYDGKLQPRLNLAHNSQQIGFIASEPPQRDGDEAGLCSAPTSAIAEEVSVPWTFR